MNPNRMANHRRGEKAKLLAAVEELCATLCRPICSADLRVYFREHPDLRPCLLKRLGQQLIVAAEANDDVVPYLKKIGIFRHKAYYALEDMGDFLRSNEQGVLFIDEVDKMAAASDWTRSIQQEIYALLDGRTDSFPGWDKELQKKLAHDFYIVGAGTWQTRYAGRQQSLGFGAKETSDAWAIELDYQDEIPDELLMRFNADVLYLRPLTGAEFEKRIVSIHKKLNRECPTEALLRHLAEKALASRRHNRWLEAYASRLLRSDIP